MVLCKLDKRVDATYIYQSWNAQNKQTRPEVINRYDTHTYIEYIIYIYQAATMRAMPKINLNIYILI